MAAFVAAFVAYMTLGLWAVGVVGVVFGAIELIPWVVGLFRPKEATAPAPRGSPRARRRR